MLVVIPPLTYSLEFLDKYFQPLQLKFWQKVQVAQSMLLLLLIRLGYFPSGPT